MDEDPLNLPELRRYLDRAGDRWPLDRALLGGARVADARGAPSQRERGPEWVLVLVSSAFDGSPWLERVYQAGALWDATEMGARAEVHCYTPKEFDRKRQTLRTVRETAESGVELLGATEPAEHRAERPATVEPQVVAKRPTVSSVETPASSRANIR